MLRIATGRPGQTITVNGIEIKITMVVGHQVWFEITVPGYEGENIAQNVAHTMPNHAQSGPK